MSATRTLAVAAVALFGAAIATAQAPVRTGQIGVRSVGVASPKPAMQMQQDLMWLNAYRQAQLWQMYQPPVVIINQNPWQPVVNVNPWATAPIVNPNPWGPIVNTNPWNTWNSTPNFYGNYNRNWSNQPGNWR